MNEYQLLCDLAKAGFTFGKDEGGTYLTHEALFEDLNKWTAALWGDRLYYKFMRKTAMPHMVLSVDGFEDQHQVWLEDDELNVDRVVSGVIHMYTWIP